MLSRFHLVPERNGQTDRRMDGQTDRQICYINIARQYARVSMLTRDNDYFLADLRSQLKLKTKR